MLTPGIRPVFRPGLSTSGYQVTGIFGYPSSHPAMP